MRPPLPSSTWEEGGLRVGVLQDPEGKERDPSPGPRTEGRLAPGLPMLSKKLLGCSIQAAPKPPPLTRVHRGWEPAPRGPPPPPGGRAQARCPSRPGASAQELPGRWDAVLRGGTASPSLGRGRGCRGEDRPGEAALRSAGMRGLPAAFLALLPLCRVLRTARPVTSAQTRLALAEGWEGVRGALGGLRTIHRRPGPKEGKQSDSPNNRERRRPRSREVC